MLLELCSSEMFALKRSLCRLPVATAGYKHQVEFPVLQADNTTLRHHCGAGLAQSV